MLLAHSISLITAGRKSKRQGKQAKTQRAKQSTPKDMVKVIKCDRCLKDTRVPLATPPKAARAKPAISKNKSTPAPGTAGPPPETAKSSNATSKKRAKSRKAGLQALLAGQQNKGASPLSLASFRQT
jgi:hypothetical protein